MIRGVLFCLLGICHFGFIHAQPYYWQQRAEYVMDIDMDAENHQFTGKQSLTYFNNSPDTLNEIFYHLYFNAFQPGSMMDVRSRSIADPDSRIGDRIFKLEPDEIGYHKVNALKQDKKKVDFEMVGTILEVKLRKPVLPGESTLLEMEFESQVPLQIRRSGRDNKEGVEFSMSQWYPKLCEFDQDGWHTNPYIGREFHGVWGTFDVTIHMDKEYVIGSTGYLENPEEVGHGYETGDMKLNLPKGDKLTWKFSADSVHDFVWAADPDFAHDIVKGDDGVSYHFFYQKDTDYAHRWDSLQRYTPQIFAIMNEAFGKYPYKKYSVIQGGDGGMEYPMATLITGDRSLRSLVGVTIHEAIHSWYQGVLATNEAKYAWMDEGFTSFASSYVSNLLYQRGSVNPFGGSYRGYYAIQGTDYQEPLSTHADHFTTNRMYYVASYSMGSMVLSQLKYIVGDEPFYAGMKRYFNVWKFKHPRPQDFKREMERESGLELDWFFENWIETTKYIDYKINEVISEDGKTRVILENLGTAPMPVELTVLDQDGNETLHYIPLRILRGEKKFGNSKKVVIEKDWPWTYPLYELVIDRPREKLKSLRLDQDNFVPDVDRSNDFYPFDKTKIFEGN